MKKIETLAEYQQLASRTCPDLGDFNTNIIHMQLGIKTEIGETLDIFKRKIAYKKDIDFVNLSEELADQIWYIANKARLTENKVFEISLSELNTITSDNFLNPESETSKINFSLNILDSLLLMVLDVKNSYNYPTALVSINALCKVWNIDLMQALTNNIEKLKVRFPDKFDTEKALNRDLKSERKQLENKGGVEDDKV